MNTRPLWPRWAVLITIMLGLFTWADHAGRASFSIPPSWGESLLRAITIISSSFGAAGIVGLAVLWATGVLPRKKKGSS